MSEQPNRRDFLKTVGTVGASGIAAAVGVDDVDAQSRPAASPTASTAAPVSHAYTFLTAPEAAFIEAAVDRLIPADDLTPGGTDCGVAVFIDRQLAGAWGSGDRTYMQGPWQKGVPTQGYQSPLTPAEFVRAGIAALNAYCRKTLQKDFDRLTADQQIKVLQEMEQGRVAFDAISAQALLPDSSHVAASPMAIVATGTQRMASSRIGRDAHITGPSSCRVCCAAPQVHQGLP